MKIEAFLRQSPLFTVNWAARKLESRTAALLDEKAVSFTEALVLAAILFEEPRQVNPSHLATLFATTRGNISHCVSSLEAKGLLGRRIDPEDARGYQLFLKPQGRKTTMQVIRTLDRMQAIFEKTVGVAKLQAALDVIRQVENVCSRLGNPNLRVRSENAVLHNLPD